MDDQSGHTISFLIEPPLSRGKFRVRERARMRWDRQDELFRVLNKVKHNRPNFSRNPYRIFENPKKHVFVLHSRVD